MFGYEAALYTRSGSL